jgi:hypothetical protein
MNRDRTRGLAVWLGMCALAMSANGQSVPANGTVPGLSYSSGSVTCQASVSLTAGAFVVSDHAAMRAAGALPKQGYPRRGETSQG